MKFLTLNITILAYGVKVKEKMQYGIYARCSRLWRKFNPKTLLEGLQEMLMLIFKNGKKAVVNVEETAQKPIIV